MYDDLKSLRIIADLLEGQDRFQSAVFIRDCADRLNLSRRLTKHYKDQVADLKLNMRAAIGQLQTSLDRIEAEE